MFADAINHVAAFTRPIHTISRYHGSTVVRPGAATLFFVNAEGYALTCRHVADSLRIALTLPPVRANIQAAFAAPRGKQSPARHRREVEKRFGLNQDTLIEFQFRLIDCVDALSDVSFTTHPTADLALIQFKGFSRVLCPAFPVFPKDPTKYLQQGRSLCRLGFPFPEFSNFAYDPVTDSISWTSTGRTGTPRFPTDGMVTRHVINASGAIDGFELSTPGLRGQSGGPAFTSEGLVVGMQSSTAHLDLDFDVDLTVQRAGHSRQVRESAVMHVGRCVHANTIKDFLRAHNVSFQEA